MSSILCGLLLHEPDMHDDVVLTAHFFAFMVLFFFLEILFTTVLQSGIFLFSMGIFRFGFVDNVLSRPLLSGLVNAVALFIIFEQLDTVTGLPSAAALGN